MTKKKEALYILKNVAIMELLTLVPAILTGYFYAFEIIKWTESYEPFFKNFNDYLEYFFETVLSAFPLYLTIAVISLAIAVIYSIRTINKLYK